MHTWPLTWHQRRSGSLSPTTDCCSYAILYCSLCNAHIIHSWANKEGKVHNEIAVTIPGNGLLKGKHILLGETCVVWPGAGRGGKLRHLKNRGKTAGEGGVLLCLAADLGLAQGGKTISRGLNYPLSLAPPPPKKKTWTVGTRWIIGVHEGLCERQWAT